MGEIADETVARELEDELYSLEYDEYDEYDDAGWGQSRHWNPETSQTARSRNSDDVESFYRRRTRWVTCRCCGTSGLCWRHVGSESKWLLYVPGTNKMHDCPANPYRRTQGESG